MIESCYAGHTFPPETSPHPAECGPEKAIAILPLDFAIPPTFPSKGMALSYLRSLRKPCLCAYVRPLATNYIRHCQFAAVKQGNSRLRALRQFRIIAARSDSVLRLGLFRSNQPAQGPVLVRGCRTFSLRPGKLRSTSFAQSFNPGLMPLNLVRVKLRPEQRPAPSMTAATNQQSSHRQPLLMFEKVKASKTMTAERLHTCFDRTAAASDRSQISSYWLHDTGLILRTRSNVRQMLHSATPEPLTRNVRTRICSVF